MGEKIPVFEPENKYLLLWEFVVFMMTSIIFFGIPIELFFEISLLPMTSWGLTIRILLFVIFLIDALIKLNVAIYDKGKLICIRKRIFRAYIGSIFESSCLLDLIGLAGLLLT